MRDAGPYEYYGYEIPLYAVLHLIHSNGAINQPVDKNGRNILHLAVRRFEHSYQVENLILLGARLNQLDNYGISAKDYAIGIESHNYGSAVRRLFMRYTRRHNNCRSVAYCLYSCLRRRQQICKDVTCLIVQAVWRTRNEKAWTQ